MMKPNDKAYQAALRATSDSCSAYQIQNALDAAYAAQFPPSEDYAGLISALRTGLAFSEKNNDAADAIETLLAKLNSKPKPSEDYAGLIERLRICESNLPGDRTLWYRNPNGPDAADALEAVLAERDALKAENESMRQSLPLWAHKQMAAERERCARIADKYEGEWHSDTADACARAIAAAIRSRK